MPAPKKNPVSSIAKKAVSKVRAGRAKKVKKKIDNYNDFADKFSGGFFSYEYKKGKLIEKERGLPNGYTQKAKTRDLAKSDYTAIKPVKSKSAKKPSMPVKKKGK